LLHKILYLSTDTQADPLLPVTKSYLLYTKKLSNYITKTYK